MMATFLAVIAFYAFVVSVVALSLYMSTQGVPDGTEGLDADCDDARQQIGELEQQLSTARTMLADANEKHQRQLETAAGRDKQHTIELGQRRGEVQRLQQELAEAVRECDIHRNGAEELRKQLKESKGRHAADVSLVNQLTVERDRLERRMVNIADMARTGKGVEVEAVKEHA